MAYGRYKKKPLKAFIFNNTDDTSLFNVNSKKKVFDCTPSEIFFRHDRIIKIFILFLNRLFFSYDNPLGWTDVDSLDINPKPELWLNKKKV